MALEHPEVRIPPPLLHLGGLLVGYGLDQALHWTLPRELITGGVFRLTRNPIYLAFALLHLGCALSLSSPGMLIMLPPILWVMHHHVIAAEEAFHEQRFGDQWQRYRQRVRRWI